MSNTIELFKENGALEDAIAPALANDEVDPHHAAHMVLNMPFGTIFGMVVEHKQLAALLRRDFAEDCRRVLEDNGSPLASPFDIVKGLLSELKTLRAATVLYTEHTLSSLSDPK